MALAFVGGKARGRATAWTRGAVGIAGDGLGDECAVVERMKQGESKNKISLARFKVLTADNM